MLDNINVQPETIEIAPGIFVPDQPAGSSTHNANVPQSFDLLWGDIDEADMVQIYNENEAAGLIPHNTGKILYHSHFFFSFY